MSMPVFSPRMEQALSRSKLLSGQGDPPPVFREGQGEERKPTYFVPVICGFIGLAALLIGAVAYAMGG